MPKILYLVTEDWVFASHFLPMVRAARAAGLEPVVATRVDRHRTILEQEGCRIVPLRIRRERLGVAAILGEIAQIMRVIARERPDMVHCIALRMVILGGLAARLKGVKRLILAVTGLGHLWVNDRGVNKLGRVLLRLAFRVLTMQKADLLFENRDDPREFGIAPAAPNVTIVPGAGVGRDAFLPTPAPNAPPVKIAIVSRMLRTKGIAEAVEATRQARALGAEVELNLFGAPDPANRDSCSEPELNAWNGEPGIHWHGPTNDVAAVWRDNHVAMLLSYREGLPRTLVEAAAAGRPIIASDVAGCREIIRDGVEGLIVPVRDADAACNAIRRLAADGDLRARLGAAARTRFVEGFTEQVVGEIMQRVYRVALSDPGLSGETT